MIANLACCLLGTLPRKIWLVFVVLVLCTVALHEFDLTGICAPIDTYHARTAASYKLVKTLIRATVDYISAGHN